MKGKLSASNHSPFCSKYHLSIEECIELGVPIHSDRSFRDNYESAFTMNIFDRCVVIFTSGEKSSQKIRLCVILAISSRSEDIPLMFFIFRQIVQNAVNKAAEY
uniref:Alpha-carbonic anhydrase domain-containing protein n=1 Tax=Parascaris univalens TaxID=6257 RepID=A0A915C3M3_PARUN